MEPTLVIADFRAQFPEFANPTAFPDAEITQYWAWAMCYINPQVYQSMPLACLQLALYMMVAHLLKQSTLIAINQNPAVVNGATIDKVSVTLQQVPVKNQWGLWLSTTAYGAQLWALLQVRSAGGYYIGGAPTAAGFRGVAGGFHWV